MEQQWQEAVKWAADRFADPVIVMGLAAGILLLGLLGYIMAWVSIFRPLGSLLRQTTRMVRETETHALMETFDQMAARRHWLMVTRNFWELWTKFRRRCYRDTEQNVWFSPQIPDDVFDENTLLRNTRITAFRHLGGYLLSIGLLFTFLGIALVVYRSSGLLAGMSTDGGVPAEISGMLANTAAKFLLSLSGLLASLLYLIAFRRSMHRLHAAMDGFCEWMNGAVVDGSPRGFILQDLGYISSVMLRTQASQQKMLAAIAVDIRQAAEKSIAEAAEKIVEVAGTLGERVVQINADGVGQIVGKVAERMQAELDETAARIKASFDAITGGLQTVANAVPETTARVERTLERTSGDLEKISSEFTNRLENQLNDFHAEGADRLIGNINDKLQSGIDRTVSDIALQFEAITAGLNQVGTNLQEAEGRIEGMLSRTESNLGGITANLVTSMNGLDEAFSTTLKQTHSGFMDTMNTAEVLKASVEGCFQDVRKVAGSLKTMAERLEGGCSALRETTSKMTEAGATLNAVAGSSAELLEKYRTAQHSQRDAVAASADALSLSASALANHLETLEGRSLPLLAGHVDKLVSAADKLGESVKRMGDGSLSRSLEGLEKASSQLTDVIEGFKLRKNEAMPGQSAPGARWWKRAFKFVSRK